MVLVQKESRLQPQKEQMGSAWGHQRLRGGTGAVCRPWDGWVPADTFDTDCPTHDNACPPIKVQGQVHIPEGLMLYWCTEG